MLLDTETPFSNAYETDHEFKEALLAVSKFQVNRGEVTTWASHLRFLTPAIDADSTGSRAADTTADAKGGHESDLAKSEPSSSTSEDSSKEYCICSERSYKSFDETSCQLQLTKSSEPPDCVHYVAVSYCWSSTPFSRPEDVGRKIQEYSINTEHGARSNKASSSILDRAILFASRRGLEFIWIDQECIEQDNPIDQRDGIQAMDLIYQRAVESISLLNTYVEKQEHLDALNLMFEGEGIEPHELESLAEVLELICSDAWFTRAWILQESTSAGSEMTLLIRCAPQLRRTAYFSSGYDHYFEVSLF
jgi:Heterokaryon incompatibility protein (HET)